VPEGFKKMKGKLNKYFCTWKYCISI